MGLESTMRKMPDASGGLRGLWASVANMTAVALIMCLFTWGQIEQRADFKAVLAQYRADMQEMHEAGRARDQAFERILADTRRHDGNEREQTRQTLSKLTQVVERLVERVERMPD